MKKIAFIGIILLAGLFSLQFILIGPRSENVVNTPEVAQLSDSLLVIDPVDQVEVIYLCPDDSATRMFIEKATRRLL